MSQYPIDNSPNKCDSLFAKMDALLPPVPRPPSSCPMTLYNNFAAPPSKRWSLFLNPLNLGWPYDFALIKSMWQKWYWISVTPQSLGLKRPCSLPLSPLRTLPSCKEVQSSLLEDEKPHGGELGFPGCQPPDVWGHITQPLSSFQMTAAIRGCFGIINRTAQ